VSNQQDAWPVPDTLEAARVLYADLEEQRHWTDQQAREEGRLQREKPARLRSRYWIQQAENLYSAILEAQERLVSRYGDAVKHPIELLATCDGCGAELPKRALWDYAGPDGPVIYLCRDCFGETPEGQEGGRWA
jgi:hypothetical protein